MHYSKLKAIKLTSQKTRQAIGSRSSSSPSSLLGNPTKYVELRQRRFLVTSAAWLSLSAGLLGVNKSFS